MAAATHEHRHVAAGLDDALALVRAHGLRLTGARRLVLEALLAVERPVSAEEIAGGFDGARAVQDLASVYRNLETLERIGLVRHVHFGHRAGLYELVGQEWHEYAVCQRCDAVIVVAAGELDPVRQTLERLLGIEPQFSHFPLVGLCRMCRGAAPGERPEHRSLHAHS